MRKILFLVFLLAACSPVPMTMDVNESMPLATPSLAGTPRPVITSTPTVDEVETAYAVIAYDQATSTAEAAAQSTAYSISQTQEAKETQAFWVGVTFAVGTEQATQTQVAGTQAAGTEQAAFQTAVPLTSTVVASTQIVEADELQSKRISIWMKNVGGAIILLVACGLLVFAFYKGVIFADEYGKAKIAQKRIDARKRDEKGRAPLIGTNDLNPGEKIIDVDLMHRATLDPAQDDLTSSQAMNNAAHVRELATVRAIAPVIAEAMKPKPAKTEPAMPAANIQISKPDPTGTAEAHIYPSLPLPNVDLLDQWDGKLLPFGVDDKAQLMRVDPYTHPHFMVVGRTRTGKTLSSIRPMVACLLNMRWDVIVMGKRVDFMPFESHPNFRLVAVDVRKEAGRYTSLLRALTAQMDIRDQILSSAHVSTWDRYGASSTMVVIDDYSGAIERMPRKDAQEVVSEVKSIALDGAKFGLNIMVGLQRPTWENISTTIRSQMARIVYNVGAVDSRIALDEEGAEKLPAQWNFLTRMTDDARLQRGVGFRLLDEDISRFLSSRAVPQNESLNWVDGVIAQEESVAVETPSSYADPLNPEKKIGADLAEAYRKADEEIALEDKIAGVWLAMRDRREWKGWNAIEREVYGEVKNGARSLKIKSMVASVQGVETSEVNAEVERLVASWGTTRSTTEGTTTAKNERSSGFSPNFDAVVA